MKQTAVEWLVEQYKNVGGISISMSKQAKEMEREQNHAEYMRGWKDGLIKQQEQCLN